MTTLNIVSPSEIDADPEDVGELACDQISRVCADLQDLVDESIVQIRSSWMSKRLGRNDELQPERLRREWEASQAFALCHRVQGVAGTLSEMADRLGAEED